MSNPLLLVVDDSKSARALIRGFVAHLRPDWRIVEAENGERAVQMANTEHPLYITLDVNMPGMSGLEVAGRIRMSHPEIRIALCTANIQASIRDAASKAGVAFVSKPITQATIQQAVDFFEQGILPSA